MDCPNCASEMESNGVSGHQVKGGRRQPVGVSWDECPDCGYVIDDMGNHMAPDERGERG